MVLGFGSLLGSPQGRSQAEAPRPEFTPIGKRSGSTSSFQVYHSYPQEQKHKHHRLEGSYFVH